MIDPMANLDPTGAPGGDMMMDSMMGSGGPDGEGSQEVFDMNAYRANLRKMDKIRSFMGIVSGCVAGICGLTGLAGLVPSGDLNFVFFPLHKNEQTKNSSSFIYMHPNDQNSMLPYTPPNRVPLPFGLQNEIGSVVIFTRIYVDISNGRFTKMRHVFHVILDVILWSGVFILRWF
ncbi:hypothetical protein ACHAXS_008702 [Conticribra weissflogii]